MLMNGNMHGLGGYDTTPALVHDYQIEEGLKSLIRAAALRTVREAREGLSGLNVATSITEFDNELDNDIMNKTLDGLAYGNDRPLSSSEFDRLLSRELTGGGLGGFFSKLKKHVKKVVRSPVKLHKKIRKSVHKVARKLKPFVKKYGAAIAAAVALYYGGPAAMAAVKKAWSKYQAKKAAALAASGAMGPPPPEGYGDDPMGPPAPPGYGIGAMTSLADNSEAIEKGALALKAQMEKSGTPMNTPGAWDFLKGVIKGQLKKKQAKMKIEQANIKSRLTSTYGPPAPAPGGMAKMVVPLAIGAGALFMLKG